MYKGPFIELLRDCTEGLLGVSLSFSAWDSVVVGVVGVVGDVDDLDSSPTSTLLALAPGSLIFGSGSRVCT